MDRSTQHCASPCTRGFRVLTRKTGSNNNAIGCWIVPSICLLEIG